MYINVFIKKYYDLILYIKTTVHSVYDYNEFTDILQNPFFAAMAKYYNLDVCVLNGNADIPKMLRKTGKNTHIVTPYPNIHVFYNKEQ